LMNALKNLYQRDSASINFNVAPATNGESVTEILGDGAARKTDQTFVLKQAPLTYISADTPNGSAATLEIRVNDLRWNELPSLYQAAADGRVYTIQKRDDGSAAVIFGDGIEGGRLPTGTTNVRATYRKYVGTAANLPAGVLTTLLQRPLGVTEVVNPEPATGGADPEIIDDAKDNAPLTVRTLDRAVSIQDYQHFARAFAGVAKAHALWIQAGPSRGIYLTIAGINGATIPTDSKTYVNLLAALRRYGDPLMPLSLVNFSVARFRLGLAVKVNEDANSDAVLANLDETLRQHFSFSRRDFGQHVSQDEIVAVAHGTKHIEAVRITRFYEEGVGSGNTIKTIIAARLPVASLTVPPQPATMLIMSDAVIDMELFV